MCMNKERETGIHIPWWDKGITPRTQKQETVDRTETVVKGVVMKMV